MSGAAANSAARRRRGTSAQNPSSKSTSNQQFNKNPISQTPINPVELLLMHDKKIYGIEQYLESSTQMLDTNDAGNKSEVFNNSSSLVLELNVLKERMDRLDDAPTFEKPSVAPSFSTDEVLRVEKLEKEVVELKRLLLKVQTFSMETNLTVMKIKEEKSKEIIENKESNIETQIETSEEFVEDSKNTNDNDDEKADETNISITFSKVEVDA